MQHLSRHTAQHKLRAQVLAIDLDRRACWGCRPGRGLCHRHRTRFATVCISILAARRDQAIDELWAA